jgi:succinate-acetate transporter protein
MGSVTAPQNIRWFVPVWVWFAFAVWVALRKSSPQLLFITFFVVFFASTVPFFCGRVGLVRQGVFGWLLPGLCATALIQIIRSVFHVS